MPIANMIPMLISSTMLRRRALTVGALLILTSPLDAQPATPAAGRAQGTRAMRQACMAGDSTRVFRRGVGDTLTVAGARVTGGTPRSQSYPEYDVVLDVPNLCVERIALKVDSLTAKVSLDARVSNLVRVSAGADVLIGNVDLTIQDVRARALLLVDLDDVAYVVDQTLTFIDNHPEVVQQLGSTLQNAGGAVGGVVGEVLGGVRGLLLGSTRGADGGVVQRLVNQATGDIVERTLSSAGQQLAQRVVGSILRLPVVT